MINRATPRISAPWFTLALFGYFALLATPTVLGAEGDKPGFHGPVPGFLQSYCADCHADGASKGGVNFDGLKTPTETQERELWFKVLKNVRAGIMPPPKKPQPTAEEKSRLEQWIKDVAFATDPRNPDPGRVTVRRLNRVEYRNTIRDLLGVDFDTEKEFPPDDSGHGFDNIGDALTFSPLLLEKYLAAAKTVVNEETNWIQGAEFRKAFPNQAGNSERRETARQFLRSFLPKAFRSPVDDETIERLVTVVEATSRQPGITFETGMRQAMIAALASPRFLFREETAEPQPAAPFFLVDEFALASRLSYFLWSSMPDDELFRLAGEGKLRANLEGQIRRMLAERKAAAFVQNFVGQWLQTRDIETVTIDARQVLNRELAVAPGSTTPPPPVDPERERRMQRFRELRAKEETNHLTMTAAELKEIQEVHDGLFGPEAQRAAGSRTNRVGAAEEGRGSRGTNASGRGMRVELSPELRRAMRQETEKTFEYLLRENRNVLELLNSDYTFLNERLARHYGLTNLNLSGDEMILVKLPADNPRGGVLSHGSVLAVTSNPTRTSPVKRGLFILENLLGTPPPPPPPDIPPLENAAKSVREKPLTLRETLAVHREAPLCSSCHNRMDPLGLALENFNALGQWREQEKGQPIDASGKLLTGEAFANVRDLKRILATHHATEFHRTLTEKMLTYALGRGLEYYDVATVDAIVERLQRANGRPSELIAAIVDSAPFQKTRAAGQANQARWPAPANGPIQSRPSQASAKTIP